jgi:hypothetical protein
MAEKKETKPVETQTFAPIAPYNNVADYSYRFTAWVNETPEKVEKAVCEIVFPGPTDEMIEGLADQAAFKFMQERYNIDPRSVFNACIGRLGTGPDYAKAETLAAVPEAHKAAQKLADEYKVGNRQPGKTTELKKKAAIGDEVSKMAEDLGMTLPEFQAFMKAQAAKKANKK